MIRTLLRLKLKQYYSDNSINKILQGARRPRYEVMLDLHKAGIVPFDAWIDIKAYLNGNEASQKGSSAKRQKNQPKEKA